MQLLWKIVYFIGRPYCSWTPEKTEKFMRVFSKYIHGNSDHQEMPGKNHIHISLNNINEFEAIARVVQEIHVCPFISYFL